ncbi:MAG: J domain-containing protein [Deltaproteobacteria bacterium]|nr:J domain-containing protein [Deltaproteobacteria bacterium]
MAKYREIIEAKETLKLPERASIKEIKSSYRRLLRYWHPDKCNDNKDKCNKMTKKIIEAYKIIISYCEQYKYSFEEDEVKKYLSEEEWWFERFGDDPLWGNKKPK